MKNIFKFLLASAFVFVFMPGCTDLDEEVFSEFTDENFPTTEQQFISALGATYTSLYSFGGHNGYLSLQEVSSDEIMIPQRGSDWFDGGVWLRVHRHEMNSAEGAMENAWNWAYSGISDCNRVTALFEGLVAEGKVDAGDAAAFIAEVKTIRAMYYLWLLDLYGNVPIVTSFAGADPNPATVDRADVYAFVEAELLENVPNLSRATDISTYARMNYYTGQAMLAKLYLNADVYKGSPEWSKAVAACDEVIAGGYSLEGDYFLNFNTDNDASKENIFVIPYDENQAQGFVLPAMTLHYSSQETFNLTFQPWNGYCSLQEFYNSYEDGDRRKGEFGNQQVRSNFHAGPQFKSDGVTPLTDSGFDDPDGENIVFTPEINEHFPGAYRQAGARVGKYQFSLGSTENLNNDFPIFRFADILLMKAEALWRMNPGDSDALALVNQVRQRAGVDPYTELTADNILAERGRELFYEGWRRSDLIRLGKWTSEWDFKPASDDFTKLMPIPLNQIAANPNLRQNPGYQ